MPKEPGSDPLTENLADFTRKLMGDLEDLRAGTITAREARVRAMLAREVLRAVHLQMEGMMLLSERAKQIESQPAGAA